MFESYALITLGNVLLYCIVNLLAKKILKSNFLKKTDDKQVWIWRNIFCSLVHSVISAVWAFSCYVQEPRLLYQTSHVFQENEASLAYYLLPASTGYFLYDTFDIIFNDGFRQWEVLSHHLAISITLFMTQIQGIYGYSVCSMIVECNSINLHIRRLTRMMTISFPSLTFFNRYSLAITTIIFRGYFSLHLTFSYLFDYKLNLPTRFFGGFAIFVMLGSNAGIIYKLYLNEFCRSRSEKDKGEKERENKLIV